MAEENSSGSGRQNLPREILEEILVKLPVKSLMRFGSVCKTWHSMFHDPGHPFINFYAQRHPRRITCSTPQSNPVVDHPNKINRPWLIESVCKALRSIFHADRADSESCLTLHGIYYDHLYNIIAQGLGDLPDGYTEFLVFGPLNNGIYFIVIHPTDMQIHSECFSLSSLQIALINPATQAYRFINTFPCEFRSLLSHVYSKPSCQLHFGFGNSTSVSDYRVVVLIQYDHSSFLVLVYDQQKGEWKKIVDSEPGERNVGERKATDAFNIQGKRINKIFHPLELCPQRFFQGCYHWLSTCEDGSYNVLSCNLVDESFKLLGGPPPPNLSIGYYQAGDVFVLHHHLALIYYFNELSRNKAKRRYFKLDIWMMMKYGVEESWTRIYTINPNFKGNFCKFYGIDYYLLEGGDIYIKTVFLKDYIRQKIISCNDAGYQVGSDCSYSVQTFYWNTPGISTYVETLERP